MNKRMLLPVLLALAFGQAGAAASDRPLLPILKAADVGPFCEKGLANVKGHIAAMEAQAPARAADGKKVFREWNDLQIALEDLQGPIDVLANMSPDKDVRTNAEACLLEAAKLATDLYQNEKLYARVKAVKPADKIDAKLQKDVLDAFEDTGVALPPEKRARMKAILEKSELLGQEFARNIRDNATKVSFTADEMKGMPADFVARAKRDDKGNILLGYGYPEYIPFMENAENAEARKRYQTAYASRGTPRNMAILKEAMELRLEMAKLFGLPSYADYATRRRMAQNPAAVDKFLKEVSAVATEAEKREIEEIRAFRAQAEGTPLAQTPMNRWDLSFWQEKLKKARYAIDQEALRKYFPSEAARDWALHISEKLYGVTFKKADVPVWHDEVVYYDVFDNKTGKRISGMYLDLYPRDGKYGHAAAWPARGVSTLAGRTPYSVLVTNFDRVGLNFEEMRTLVHEFGHVLHGVLSNTRYVSNSGTSVERDFVEAPSQMFEEWARAKESLALLPQFCKSACPSIDDAMLKRLTAANNFGRGIRYARQLLYASYDMSLHTPTLVDPQAQWAKMEGATPLGYVQGTEFAGTFGHLLGGYAAGYYGYMWSEVMALDMLSRYHGKLMDPATGMHYRKSILARGSELRGQDLVRGFLGRAPNSKAFFDEISGKRLQ